jgi:Txe/YoeB family toxin of Txe-Axe toxin-antitoxin module
MYTLYFTNEEQKDAKKIARLNLKKVQELLELISKDHFQNSPSFKKLY